MKFKQPSVGGSAVNHTKKTLKQEIIFPFSLEKLPCSRGCRDGSMRKGTCYQTGDLSFIPRTHMEEDEKLLLQVVL